jgi:hypothetical protein
MSKCEQNIVVLKQGAHDTIRRRDESALKDKRRAELKKIKDELLTLARRVEAMEEEAA